MDFLEKLETQIKLLSISRLQTYLPHFGKLQNTIIVPIKSKSPLTTTPPKT